MVLYIFSTNQPNFVVKSLERQQIKLYDPRKKAGAV